MGAGGIVMEVHFPVQGCRGSLVFPILLIWEGAFI